MIHIDHKNTLQDYFSIISKGTTFVVISNIVVTLIVSPGQVTIRESEALIKILIMNTKVLDQTAMSMSITQYLGDYNQIEFISYIL